MPEQFFELDRHQMGRELLELGSSALLEQQFLDMLAKWGQKIKDAVAHCCLDLGDALEARKTIKGEPKSLDQWKELGPECLRGYSGHPDE